MFFKERQIDKDTKAIQKATDKLLGEDLISMDQAVEIKQAALERSRQEVEVKLGRDEVQALQRLTQSGKLKEETSQTVKKAMSKEGYKPLRSRSYGVAPLYTRRSFLIPSGTILGAGVLTAFCIRDSVNIESSVNNEVNKIMESAKANTQLAHKEPNQQSLDTLHKGFEDKKREEAVRSKLYEEKFAPHRLREKVNILGVFISVITALFGVGFTTSSIFDWQDDRRG